jgi:glycosyltransferase involved in cell wall biosynthesis
MLTIHNVLATWQKRVTLFVALTDFQRQKFVAAGLDTAKITVKPNFVPVDLGAGRGDGDYVLYVGRLSMEKGVRVLLEAWKRAACPGRLILVGDGPLAPWLRKLAESERSLVYLGRRPLRDVYELMGGARALAFPSMWYEGMPRTIIEAFCRGTPVIASRTGSMTEMVADGETGWLVQPNDPVALAARLREVFGETERLTGMRAAARRMFEARYTPQVNYRFLMDIYNRAILLGRGA